MHITQQMPLPLIISCASKSRLVLPFLVLPFWYLLTRVVPDIFHKSSKMVVCVCVPVLTTYFDFLHSFITKSLTHTQPFYGSLDFVPVSLGELAPEETFNHLAVKFFTFGIQW